MGLTDGGCLTDDVLRDYKDALENVKAFIEKRLSIFCECNSIGSMTSDRIKSIQGIAKKLQNKGFVGDVAGMRLVFCDLSVKNEFDKNKKTLKDVDNDINNWNKQDFIDEFMASTMKPDNGNIRIIYDFCDFIVREVEKKQEFKILIPPEKDYIACPKQKSGYQSLHLYIFYKDIPVEIQLRNLVQHYYAQYEHDKRYKTDEANICEYNNMFDRCANLLHVISDNYFDFDSGIVDGNVGYSKTLGRIV